MQDWLAIFSVVLTNVFCRIASTLSVRFHELQKVMFRSKQQKCYFSFFKRKVATMS